MYGGRSTFWCSDSFGILPCPYGLDNWFPLGEKFSLYQQYDEIPLSRWGYSHYIGSGSVDTVFISFIGSQLINDTRSESTWKYNLHEERNYFTHCIPGVALFFANGNSQWLICWWGSGRCPQSTLLQGKFWKKKLHWKSSSKSWKSPVFTPSEGIPKVIQDEDKVQNWTRTCGSPLKNHCWKSACDSRTDFEMQAESFTGRSQINKLINTGCSQTSSFLYPVYVWKQLRRRIWNSFWDRLVWQRTFNYAENASLGSSMWRDKSRMSTRRISNISLHSEKNSFEADWDLVETMKECGELWSSQLQHWWVRRNWVRPLGSDNTFHGLQWDKAFWWGYRRRKPVLIGDKHRSG